MPDSCLLLDDGTCRASRRGPMCSSSRRRTRRAASMYPVGTLAGG